MRIHETTATPPMLAGQSLLLSLVDSEMEEKMNKSLLKNDVALMMRRKRKFRLTAVSRMLARRDLYGWEKPYTVI